MPVHSKMSGRKAATVIAAGAGAYALASTAYVAPQLRLASAPVTEAQAMGVASPAGKAAGSFGATESEACFNSICCHRHYL